MPVGAFVPSRIHLDYPEWQSPVIGDVGKVWAWNGSGYAPVSLAFDPAGTAAAAIATHVGESDPHTQYLLESAFVPGGSTTQVQYNNAGAFAGDSGMTYDAANDRLTVAGGLVAPSMRPTSDSTTAIQLQNAAGTAVATVDTTNNLLYVPTPSATTRAWLAADGLRITTNAGTSINSFLISSLDTIINSRQSTTIKSNGTTWLSGSNIAIAFTAATITFSDASGGINMVGTILRGSNHLGLQAADDRFTVTVKQNSALGGTADILRVQTQAGGASLYVNVNGYVAIGQSSASAAMDLAASTTARASLRIRAGTAPTAPNAGDIYFDGTNFFGYNGSAWKQLDN